jgi:TonB family protein
VVYHVQTEDCGRTKPKIKTCILDRGAVVATIESTYARLACSPEFSEKEVARRLTAQHWKAVKDLQAGRLYLDGKSGGRGAHASGPTPAKPAVEKRIASAVDPSSAKRPADQRVTTLAMALAAVSVTLAVLALPSLYLITPSPSRGTPDPPAPVGSYSTPPLVDPAGATPFEPGVSATTTADTFADPTAVPAVSPVVPRIRPTVRPPAPSAERPARAVERPSAPRTSTPAAPAPKPAPSPPASRPPSPEPEPPALGPESRPVEPDAAGPEPDAAGPEPDAAGPEPDATSPPAPRPSSADPYPLDDVDVPPVLTSRRVPAYTKRAVRKGQEGRVEMNLLIDEQGRVADLRLERTIPDSDLNEMAIYAVRRWRFEPA